MNSSVKYDSDFKKIGHYEKYPELRPWIGENYPNRNKKLLIFGESHYLPEGVTYHHDVSGWYANRIIKDENGGWISTRGVVESNKTLWKSLSRALKEAGIGNPETEIALMNFFQRPANYSGGGIKPEPQDKTVANEVSKQVVEIIKPDMVAFVSAEAYRWAWVGSFITLLNEKGIESIEAPHPSHPPWNSTSNKRCGKTGKQYFIDFVKTIVQ